jgi:hypothetical protein
MIPPVNMYLDIGNVYEYLNRCMVRCDYSPIKYKSNWIHPNTLHANTLQLIDQFYRHSHNLRETQMEDKNYVY